MQIFGNPKKIINFVTIDIHLNNYSLLITNNGHVHEIQSYCYVCAGGLYGVSG
jgi:aminopeptidase-like protein